MARKSVDLDRLTIFVAAADAGTFTAAAARLGATKAMVSQQIARLEEQLSTALFRRTTRKVTLTEEGVRLRAECAPLLASLQEAVARVGEQKTSLQGLLRVTVGVDHLNAGFAAPLAEFARQHPRLTLDILASDALVDLVAEGVDLAIRRGWPKDSSMRATVLGAFEQWLVVSPDYVKQYGRPTRPKQLEEHTFIVFTALKGAHAALRFTGPGGAKVTARVRGNVRCSSPVGVLALARAGGGIASVASTSAQDDIARGLLLRVLPDWKLPNAGVYLMYPATRHVAPKTRALVDFLRAWSTKT